MRNLRQRKPLKNKITHVSSLPRTLLSTSFKHSFGKLNCILFVTVIFWIVDFFYIRNENNSYAMKVYFVIVTCKVNLVNFVFTGGSLKNYYHYAKAMIKPCAQQHGG